VVQHTFTGVRLAVPTAFGIITTHWPLARISIGEEGVELISAFPLRSEWYASLSDIDSVRSDGRSLLILREDGGTALFKHWNWSYGAIVTTFAGCGIEVIPVDEVTDDELI
jgi:hypothetical protein